jgi:hypothetical protein
VRSSLPPILAHFITCLKNPQTPELLIPSLLSPLPTPSPWVIFFSFFFALVIFQTGSHIYAQVGLNYNCIYTSLVAGMTGAQHCTQLFIGYEGVLQTVCLGWPQTEILPISTFQIARITCVSHHSQLLANLIETNLPLSLQVCLL